MNANAINETPTIQQLLTSLNILTQTTLHAISEKVLDEVRTRVLGDMFVCKNYHLILWHIPHQLPFHFSQHSIIQYLIMY